MKKFALKSLLFCLIPLPVLFALNYMVDTGLRKSNHTLYADWNNVYQSKINADLIIMGGSRAWVHISPQTLDSTLNLNSYNLGTDGYTFGMQYTKLRVYLQHNKKPKYIVHSLDMTTVTRRKDLYQWQQFLPYMRDTIIQNSTSNYIGKFSIPQYYFPLYKYNNEPSLIKEGIKAYFGMPSGQPSERYKGYKGSTAHWTYDPLLENKNGVNIPPDTEVMREYDQFLQYCKANGIKVIFVFTPQYHEFNDLIPNMNNVTGIYTSFSRKYDFPFLNYATDSITYNKDLFYDSWHMNIWGAEPFTRRLAMDLKNLGVSK